MTFLFYTDIYFYLSREETRPNQTEHRQEVRLNEGHKIISIGCRFAIGTTRAASPNFEYH